MQFLSGLFIVMIVGIVASTIGQIVKAIAGRGASKSQLAELRTRLEQYAAALEDAQSTLASQATELAELQERVDFAERLLAQARDRPALGAGHQPP